MSKQLATITVGPLPTLDVNPEALALKNSALEAARAITEIICEEDVAAATEAAGRAKGLAKDLDDQRLRDTKPLRDWLEQAKKDSDLYGKELLSEVKRLEGLLSDHVRKQREEQQRQERERQAAILAATRAKEALAAAQQAAAAAATAAERKQAQAQLSEAKEKAADAIVDVHTALAQPMTQVEGIAGAKVKPGDYDYEIDDPAALYESHPYCVDLVPKRDAIRSLINSGTLEIPGVRVFLKDKVHTKRVSSALTLNK